MLNLVGKAAFVVGVLFAFCGGIWGGVSIPTNDGIVIVLLIAGILIGILNITASEAPAVLATAVAFIILSLWGNSSSFWPVLHLSKALAENVYGIFVCFAILMAPAAIIVAIKAVIATANRD
jgi:hypothetical protein